MLELRNITKNYGNGPDAVNALKGIDLNFERSGFVTILGPSGCGKTTLLNIVGGLDKYTSGDLVIEGKSTKTFKDRDWDSYRNHRIGFVFQTYNLIPHLSVVENVELSLVLNGTSAAVRRKKALDALESVGLSDKAKKKPNQLSGGQMQRVAIARAIVNDPEVILADEPTGALDSDISVQVLDILHTISKTKLIIMVTHNDVLAQQYADRIIRMKDGLIVGDTANVKSKQINEKETLEKEANPKTSMGFGTALKISLRNMHAKKGRSALASLAGAIGVVGVALVLAVSSGFQNYIDKVEAQTVNAVPVTITTAGQQQLTILNPVNLPANPDDEEIYVYKPPTSQTITVHYNRFTEEYLNYVEDAVDLGLAQSVMVNYGNMKMNLTSSYVDGNGVTQYKLVNELQGGSLINQTLGLPTSIYHELYGEQKFIEASYDILGKGTYPKDETEIVLIVDRYNRIPMSIYNALGLGNVSVEDGKVHKVSFDDLIGREFKVIYNHAFYSEEVLPTSPYMAGLPANVRRFMQPNTARLKELFESNDPDVGMTLKISGIMRVRNDAVMSLMKPSIGYTKALKNRFLQRSLVDTPVVDAVFNNVMPNGTEAMTILQDVQHFMNTGENPDPTKYAEKDSKGIPDPNRPFTTIEQFAQYAAQNAARFINPIVENTNDTTKIMSLTGYLSKGLSLGADLTNQFGNNPDAEDFDISSGQINIPALVSLIARLTASSLTTSIAVFPNDLTTKPDLLKYLNAWNDDREDIDKIYHLDVSGMVTEGVGIVLQIITIVLIVFASLALVVSSVMTGILTYVSVIERKKEIGVLRALGAQKLDVGVLFQTEAVITGLLSGLIGVISTYLLSLPINLSLNYAFPDQGLGQIANLPIWMGLVLIGISILLTFVAGLLPSQIAAKKDPVESLRAE